MNKRSPRRYIRLSAAEKDGRVYWGHEDVLNLVAKVGELWPEFCNGVQKKKYLWRDIATKIAHDDFTPTGNDCDRKWRNLKIRYLAVLEKQMKGENPGYRIDYFDSIHSFLKDDQDTLASLVSKRSSSIKGEREDTDEASDDDGVMEWTDKSISLLLDLLLEFKDWFTDKDPKRDDTAVWESVSEQMKLEGHQPGPEECRRKWYSLAKCFQKHKTDAEASGTVPLWPYYTRVRRVVGEIGVPTVPPENEIQNQFKRKIRIKRGKLPIKRRMIKTEVEDEEEELVEDSEFLMTNTPVTVERSVPIHKISSPFYRDLCDRLERVEQSLSTYRRLDRVEAKLEELNQQQEAQSQTNALLTQVVAEVSRLSNLLSSRSALHRTRDDSADLGSGITIVVPHSQHLQ